MLLFSAPDTSLSIIVALRDASAPLWCRDIIAGLKADGHSVRVLVPERSERGFSLLWDAPGRLLSPYPAYRLYRALERRAGKPSSDQDERATTEAEPSSRGSRAECDLLVDLAGGSDDTAFSPRLGTLRAELGDGGNVVPRLRSLTYRTALHSRVRFYGPTGVRAVAAEALIPAHAFSLDRSLNRCKSRIAPLVRKAASAIARGEDYRSPRWAEDGKEKPAVLSGPASRFFRPIAWRLLRNAVSSFLGRTAERLLFRQQWTIVVSSMGNDAASPRRQMVIVPPADRFWADPFPYRKDGSLWLFFEEQLFSAPYARLACARIGRDGKPERSRTILEKPYHLSYPYLIESDGELFMIPESHQNKSVDLYRCVGFPDAWEKVSTLIDGFECADTSVFRRPDGWWLLTSMRSSPGASLSEELYAFRSDRLDSSEWTPHPDNPIVSDVRSSRCAGRIFELDGMLFRPSQDCAGGYGKAVVLNEIVELTERAYREEPRVVIPASSIASLSTLHTYNSTGDDVVVDGQVRRFKPRVIAASLLSNLGARLPSRLKQSVGADISMLEGLAAGYYE